MRRPRAESPGVPGRPDPIAALGLERHVERALLAGGIERIDDLVRRTWTEVAGIPRVGRTALPDIEIALADLGLRLAMDDPRVEAFRARSPRVPEARGDTYLQTVLALCPTEDPTLIASLHLETDGTSSRILSDHPRAFSLLEGEEGDPAAPRLLSESMRLVSLPSAERERLMAARKKAALDQVFADLREDLRDALQVRVTGAITPAEAEELRETLQRGLRAPFSIPTGAEAQGAPQLPQSDPGTLRGSVAAARPSPPDRPQPPATPPERTSLLRRLFGRGRRKR